MSEDLYQKASELSTAGIPSAMITIVEAVGSAPRHAGSKMIVCLDGEIFGTVGGSILEARLIELAKECISNNKSLLTEINISGNVRENSSTESIGMICGGSVKAFIEPIIPAERIVVFGGGHVGLALYKICDLLGFKITILDDRDDFANKSRFPNADVTVCENYENAFDEININENTYIIILTRGHIFDAVCLKKAFETNAKYIGMISSRKKLLEIKEKLLNEGASQEKFGKLHSPIGLDINAETPEEIAVSIAAELIKIKRQAKEK